MIDQYPPANGVLTSLIWRKTMSGGETSLSGYDNASQALSYTPGQEQVYLNGILLVRGDDYTATNGTSITGLSALSASDFVQVNCYNNFSVASLPSTSITGEITNSQITSLAASKLTGTVANNQLANSSITINGSAVSLGGSTTIAGGSAQDDAPTSPTEGQLWLDTNGTLATTGFTEKATLTTTGDIYYASAANTPARLGIGSTSQVLTVSGGLPVWSTPAAGGKILQIVSTTIAASRSTSSSTFVDISGASASITPSATTSKILVYANAPAFASQSSGGGTCYGAINTVRGSTEINRVTSGWYISGGTGGQAIGDLYAPITMITMDEPATTSSITYKLQFRNAGGTAFYASGSSSEKITLVLMEVSI